MAAAKVFKCVIMCYYVSFMYRSCTGHVQVMYKLFYGNTNFMYYDSPVLTMLSWHISENPFFSDCIIRDHPHYSLSSLLLLYHCINPNLRLLSLKVSFFSILKPDFSDLLHIFEPLEMINICM